MVLNDERKGATAYTRQLHDDILKHMNTKQIEIETEDVADVKKHLILELGAQDIKDENGNIIWNRQAQTALTSLEYPDTVNPYLWNIYRDGYIAGVLKFTEGFYVVTGLDSSTIGFIRSKNGWIIQDCGNSVPAAEISIKLVEKALNENIHDHIVAIIYSHTHTDHLGGVEAFVTADQVGNLEDGKIPIIAPAEFEQSLIDDNLYAGVAMSRRLQYQCGLFLRPDEKGRVSIGLASTLGVHGRNSSIMPTWIIEEDGTVVVDGVKLTFVLTPNTETRAHMCTYFNDYKVLFLGDNSVGTLHNTYTMRGAPVRDANYWGKVLYHLYGLFGDEVEAIYQGHGLPHFKMQNRSDNLKQFLLDNAVSYKYTHDQALLLANKGYSIHEVGHQLKMPESIARTWYTREHYGSYSFNARGIIQKYLGFYDGNPVNLLPLPKQELAKKLIDYIGSEELVLKKALEDFDKGEYQWVATVTSYVVYYNPENWDARYLCADSFEQLGYQAENALWRNAYLAAALDLRHPEFSKNLNIRAMDNGDVIPHVSVDLLLDHLGINFDGSSAIEMKEQFIIKVRAEKVEYHRIHIYKGTILHELVTEEQIKESDQVITLSKEELYQLSVKRYQGQDKLLKQIEQYVVDTSQYKNFNLIEPVR